MVGFKPGFIRPLDLSVLWDVCTSSVLDRSQVDMLQLEVLCVSEWQGKGCLSVLCLC